jgi:hypothetical protein
MNATERRSRQRQQVEPEVLHWPIEYTRARNSHPVTPIQLRTRRTLAPIPRLTPHRDTRLRHVRTNAASGSGGRRSGSLGRRLHTRSAARRPRLKIVRSRDRRPSEPPHNLLLERTSVVVGERSSPRLAAVPGGSLIPGGSHTSAPLSHARSGGTGATQRKRNT